MKIQNINLNTKHFNEIQIVINDNIKELKKLGDSIIELEDDTRILVILQNNIILCQYLDSLI